MHELNEMKTKLSQLRHQDFIDQAEQARLVARYLRETKAQRTWRFRIAEGLLRLATQLSPYHRTIIQSGQKTSGTIITR